MSAETLRKAAALMRERAKAAPEGPWLLDESGYKAPGWPDDMWYRRVVRGEPNPISGWREKVVSTDGATDGTSGAVRMAAIGEHIASWHPAVALAVADVLDEAADVYSLLASRTEDGDLRSLPAYLEKAIAAAHAYLGDDA